QVELVSSPYSSQQQQVTSDAAVGTLSDVVGLDGAWIYDLNEQSALVPLDDYIEDSDIDESDLANVVSVNDETLMISAVNFTHPLFVNTDLLAKAGIDHAPQTREEFKNSAIALSELNGVAGWVLPLNTQNPVSAKNDILSWL